MKYSNTCMLRELLKLPSSPTTEAKNIAAKLLADRNDPSVVDFFEFFLDVFDVKFGCSGLISALPGFEDLLRITNAKFGFAGEFLKSLNEAMAEFIKIIRENPKDFGGRPAQFRNIIIFYLSNRRSEVLRRADGAARWEKLCLVGYLKTKAGIQSSIETQMRFFDNSETAEGSTEREFVPMIDKQAEENVCAVAKVLNFVPLKSIRTAIPLFIKKKTVEKALRLANRQEPFATKIANYIKWAQQLFLDGAVSRHRLKLPSVSEKKSHLREHGNLINDSRQIKEAEKLVGGIFDRYNNNKPNFNSRELLQLKARDIREQQIKIEIEEGASPDEFRSPPTAVEKFDYRKFLIERAKMQRPLGWDPVWAKRFVTLEQLGVIISQLVINCALSNKSNTDECSQTLIFVLSQVFFGFHPEYLINAQVKSSVDELTIDRSSPLVYSNGSFLFIRKSEISKMYLTIRSQNLLSIACREDIICRYSLLNFCRN